MIVLDGTPSQLGLLIAIPFLFLSAEHTQVLIVDSVVEDCTPPLQHLLVSMYHQSPWPSEVLQSLS